jgi:Gram-negative bacterial TonB protein C-terminal
VHRVAGCDASPAGDGPRHALVLCGSYPRRRRATRTVSSREANSERERAEADEARKAKAAAARREQLAKAIRVGGQIRPPIKMLLDQAALDAVRQWVYQPSLLNGVPTAVVTTVTVKFTRRMNRTNLLSHLDRDRLARDSRSLTAPVPLPASSTCAQRQLRPDFWPRPD